MRRFLMVGALALVFLAPVVVMAWVPGQPIVPACEFSETGMGPYCTACDLIELVNNLLAFAVYLTAFIATIMFTYAGFLYVSASTNAENISKAKEIFGKVLIGFVFVLTAWLIVDIILSVFTEKDFGFWTNLQCSQGYPSLEDATPTTVGYGSSANRCSDSSCYSNSAEVLARLDGTNVTVTSSGNCDNPNNSSCTGLAGMKKDAVDDMVALSESLEQPLEISGGTEVGHQASCQIRGSCPDIDFSDDFIGTEGDYNVENINKVIEESKKLGRCPVFEPKGGQACPAEVTSCQQVSRSTGSHFSFYEC